MYSMQVGSPADRPLDIGTKRLIGSMGRAMASRDRYRDARQPGLTPRVAPSRGSTETPAAALLRLQRSAGNRTVTRLLQREPTSSVTPEQVEAWSADHTNATTYAIQYYERIRSFLSEKEKAQKAAEEAFKGFKDLKEPPSLELPVVGAIFSAVLALVPGGKAISLALQGGSFISTLTGLAAASVDVASEHPAGADGHPTDTGAHKEGKAGKHKKPASAPPVEEHKSKTAETVGKVHEGVVEVSKTIRETREKREQAIAAEEDALLFQKLSHERISSWADLTGRSHKEETEVTDWLARAQASHKWRGRLLELVKSRLGPQLPDGVSSEISLELARSYELELFRRYFKEHKAVLVDVKYWGFEELGPIYSEIELDAEEHDGGKRIEQPVRRHIIEDLLKKLPKRYLGNAAYIVGIEEPDALYGDALLARVFRIPHRAWERHDEHLDHPIYGSPDELKRQLWDYWVKNFRPELKTVTQRLRTGYYQRHWEAGS
jgi:hypothetical protein